MPTYEYVCKNCGHEFEEFQSMLADVLTVCPKCKKKALKRKIGTGAGIIFKGSGFYCTDYSGSAKSGSEYASCSPSSPSSGAKKGKKSTKK